MKEFVCDEVVGFQVSILLKVNFSTFNLQDFANCLETHISRKAF